MSVCNYATITLDSGGTPAMRPVDVCMPTGSKDAALGFLTSKVTCDAEKKAQWKFYSGSDCNGTSATPNGYTVTVSDCDKKGCDYMYANIIEDSGAFECSEATSKMPLLVDVCRPQGDGQSVKLSQTACDGSSGKNSIAAYNTPDCTGDRLRMGPTWVSTAACMESGSVSGEVEACVNGAPGKVNIWINLGLVAVLTAALAMM